MTMLKQQPCWRRVTRCLAALTALVFVWAGPATADVPDGSAEVSALFQTCFARVYDRRISDRRVTRIAVYFQGFKESLLSGVVYRLRYGTKFGFSGECSERTAGGFLCQACDIDNCDNATESFKILWSGGEEVQLVGQGVGILGENEQGGRDRIATFGQRRAFLLTRAEREDCRW